VVIGAESVAQLRDKRPFEIYGTTSPEVADVLVKYKLGRANHEVMAVLLRADDGAALADAGIKKPFGFFFAELPPKVSVLQVRALGLGAEGEKLGRVTYDRFRQLYPQSFIPGAGGP
jgi:hypothetical protein